MYNKKIENIMYISFTIHNNNFTVKCLQII